MNKVIAFDMDGTIADLYGVEDWLKDLRNENIRPYAVARPMYDMSELNEVLAEFKTKGWIIGIISWSAKGGSKDYNKRVADTKKNWLAEVGFPADFIHIVKYGTTKADATRKMGGFQILVDDNATVRKGWHLGATIDANENVIEKLKWFLEE